MTDHDLLQEIRHVREKLARECNHDPHQIGERMRKLEREEMSRGVKYVSFAPNRHAATEAPVMKKNLGEA